MPRILLTYPPSARATWYGDSALNELAQLGELVLRQQEPDLSEDDLLDLARGCELIISDKPTAGTERLFRENHTLVAFLRCAMDIKSIDIAAASRHGVLVTQAGPSFVHAVSELIVAQMINLSRELPHYFADYRRRRTPAQRMGRQLAGMTAGIIGFGNIAATLTPVLQALGLRVLTHDPYLVDTPPGVERVDLETLLGEADQVICLARYSQETDNMANGAFFSKMKPGSFFINASRGGLVDEEALASCLADGHLAGAAIDVGRGYDDQPTATLAYRAEVLATPHIGGMVPEAIACQARQTVQQARLILAGEIPEGAVNPHHARRLARRARS
ncbi:NAD(P)-dependent oxidoreductase [Phytopseudomonas dryadis]|uniref:Hydroxyacid dehydrogenase n=1 Tax=Phytopseudomonas dryadis TaxID=2487520 RepID=A0A4Q9R730_9GAMM|nr:MULTISPECIES: NAD(P)-dependent oxidoreductase [Pseudomonas]TBU96354.1 hydroxyacid dehydrogenase [Pseudomonas dryadis]TBV00884.1 hydroxyacid dehydrogenase [Pseudomonas dryadis]TBV13571.1 hydroxyacid dehydrogenase [Pseudomonas sp. FRB 230]